MAIKTALKIEDKRWKIELPDVQKLVKKAVSQAWKYGNVGDLYLDIKNAEASFVLSDNETVQKLNKDYRGVDKPTNVLSFAALDDEDEPIVDPLFLGDVILAFETTKNESIEQGIALENHLFHLVVHGVLHLIGYDHIDSDEAEEMETLEIAILEKNGIGNPYEN